VPWRICSKWRVGDRSTVRTVLGAAFSWFSRVRVLTFFPVPLTIPVTYSTQNRPSTIEHCWQLSYNVRKSLMFARGVVSLHTAHLPVPKTLASKSRISITSKLIEIKGLQLHYFGHLRKTGGRGSYRLVHTAYLRLRKPHGTKFNHSRRYEPLSRKSNYSRTYGTPQGWGVFPGPTFKFHLKCRRADISSSKSVVVFCFLLLIECSHKGWQDERGVGNIVPCRCE